MRVVRQLIRESEVLVYAIGIDGDGDPLVGPRPPRRQQRPPIPLPRPWPWPGGKRPFPPKPPPIPNPRVPWTADERVNDSALREMTDDSGGRTEIIRGAGDLNPATAGIADELSRQYLFGYQATGKKDGRWHSIRVEVRGHDYHVRARRGYIAS